MFNIHDEALLKDITRQPHWLPPLYLGVAACGAIFSVTFTNNEHSAYLLVMFLSGLLTGLAFEKLVTRRIGRLLRDQLSQAQSGNNTR